MNIRILLILINFFLMSTTLVDYKKEKFSILQQYMDKSPKELFKVWHYIFSRKYSFETEEAKERFKIFKDNLAFIKKSNEENKSFKVGLNQFSDMTNEEFKSKMATYKLIDKDFDGMIPFVNKDLSISNKDPKFLNENDDDDLTKRILLDYSSINYSNYYIGVKDQASCGGCWAFAVTGAVEGNKAISLGRKSENLSTQNLIDCDSKNMGCSGGDMRTSFSFIKSKGVMNEADYGFKGYTSNCLSNYLAPLTFISSFLFCSNKTQYKCSTSIVYYLLTKGPVAVTIDGGSSSFQHYQSGIFTGYCSEINHSATLVGYASSDNQNYWIIRNSWSNTWGEDGYIRVAVNPGNKFSCFIEFEAIQPVIKN